MHYEKIKVKITTFNDSIYSSCLCSVAVTSGQPISEKVSGVVINTVYLFCLNLDIQNSYTVELYYISNTDIFNTMDTCMPQ